MLSEATRGQRDGTDQRSIDRGMDSMNAPRHLFDVIELREMRARNHLTDAVVEDIRRRLKESGS